MWGSGLMKSPEQADLRPIQRGGWIQSGRTGLRTEKQRGGWAAGPREEPEMYCFLTAFLAPDTVPPAGGVSQIPEPDGDAPVSEALPP